MVPSALTLGSHRHLAADDGLRVRRLRQPGHVLHADRHRVHQAAGRLSRCRCRRSSCSQAMSQNTADSINRCCAAWSTPAPVSEAGLKDRDNAGKTGTTDARKNAWFVGYTSNLSAAVWVGSPSQRVEMNNITIGGQFHEQVYGGQVPGPIWRDAMTGALPGPDARRRSPRSTSPTRPEGRRQRADRRATGGNNQRQEQEQGQAKPEPGRQHERHRPGQPPSRTRRRHGQLVPAGRRRSAIGGMRPHADAQAVGGRRARREAALR